jgi:hypothetical protein
MNPPAPPRNDTDNTRPSSSPHTLTQLLTNGYNVLDEDITQGQEDINVDLRETLKKFATILPFVLLLLFRFLLAYIAKFFSLLFISLLQHRIHYIFDEQISLKSSTNRNTLWTLLTSSAGMLTLIYLLSPLVLGINVVERLSLDPFHPESYDFISLIMLCYFSDSTLRLLVCSVKIVIYFLLNPRSAVTDSTATTPFPNFACMHWDCIPVFSSFTSRG